MRYLQPGKRQKLFTFLFGCKQDQGFLPFFLASDFQMLFQIPEFIPFCSRKKSLHLGKLELAKGWESETEGEVFLWIAFSSCRRQAGAQQVDSLVSERFSWMDFFHWLQPFPYCSHSHPPTHTQVNVNINSFGHIRKDSKPQVIYSFSLSEGESKSITVA